VATRLSVFVGARDSWHHRPLYSEIVHRAHRFGLAGATVLRGVEGFGVTSQIHTTHLLGARDDVPLVVIIVDTEDRIRAFLPRLDEFDGVCAVLDTVEVVAGGSAILDRL
jgi:uncharacterized protein